MYVECLETLAEFLSPSYLPLYEKALKRMQRYGYYRLTEHRNANVARNYGILYIHGRK